MPNISNYENKNICIMIKTYLTRSLIKYSPTILLKPNDPQHLIRKIPLEDFLVGMRSIFHFVLSQRWADYTKRSYLGRKLFPIVSHTTLISFPLGE